MPPARIFPRPENSASAFMILARRSRSDSAWPAIARFILSGKTTSLTSTAVTLIPHGREDRPQILLAVATDTEGVSIHLEVLRGNRADTTTIHGLLASLKRRFGIQQAIFVFDNGMSSTLNLETMRKEDLHFVTRLSAATL